MPFVLKIGGSLFGTGRVRRLLRMVARTPCRAVIVPGGGPYADAVRAAQRAENFSDREAHIRAIFAMHALAREMIDMQPRLACAETLQGIRACWDRGAIPVWLPARLVRGDQTIPSDWSITSDGLAARLAERLGRCPVVLVKSCRAPKSRRAGELARRGVIDAAFPAIVRRSGLQWCIIGPGEDAALARMLRASGSEAQGKQRR